MKLREACEIGREMGCHTIREAVANIRLHMFSIFDMDSYMDELAELEEEYKTIPPWMVEIEDLLKR